MSTEQMPIKPSAMLHFVESLNGAKGDLDAWLECFNEAECRAFICAYAAQEVAKAASSPQLDRRMLFAAIRSLGYTTSGQTEEICDVVFAAIRARGSE